MPGSARRPDSGIGNWRDQRELFVSSYFDGQGTQRRSLELDDGEVAETWWLETAYPNRPLRIVAGEEELRLQRSERTQYWRRSGDEVPWFPAPALD